MVLHRSRTRMGARIVVARCNRPLSPRLVVGLVVVSSISSSS